MGWDANALVPNSTTSDRLANTRDNLIVLLLQNLPCLHLKACLWTPLQANTGRCLKGLDALLIMSLQRPQGEDCQSPHLFPQQLLTLLVYSATGATVLQVKLKCQSN